MKKSYGYLNHLDDYLTTSPGQIIQQTKYLRGLEFMFSKFMENQINPSGKTSDIKMDNFNFASFLNDYESVMKSEPRDQNSDKERKPYEGVEVEAANALLKNVQKYNKPAIECLKDKVREGADLDVFRAKTTYNASMSSEDALDCKRATGAMYKVIQP